MLGWSGANWPMWVRSRPQLPYGVRPSDHWCRRCAVGARAAAAPWNKQCHALLGSTTSPHLPSPAGTQRSGDCSVGCKTRFMMRIALRRTFSEHLVQLDAAVVRLLWLVLLAPALGHAAQGRLRLLGPPAPRLLQTCSQNASSECAIAGGGAPYREEAAERAYGVQKH